MSTRLVQSTKAKIIGADDIHLEALVAVDTNVPASYIKMWDISKGVNDKVTAYLTGSGNNLSLHIYGSGDMANFAMPNKNQYPHYTAPWASYTDRIKHIYIHNGVTSLGQFMFMGYHGTGYQNSSLYRLETLEIASTVRVINRYAVFYSPISSIVIPNGVRTIHEKAFELVSNNSNCTVNISDTVRIIEYSAFLHTGLYESIQSDFKIIGDGCLIQYTGNKQNLTIPEGVKSITLANWSEKANCTSITLPYSLKYLTTFAFGDFTSLRQVLIPQNCRLISANAFGRCTSLQAVYIPQRVKKVLCKNVITATGAETSSPASSPFYGCPSSLKIYCGASQKPDGFGEYWDYTGDSTRATVYWGVSENEYNEAVMSA